MDVLGASAYTYDSRRNPAKRRKLLQKAQQQRKLPDGRFMA
jgi:hypothetical protein